MRCILEATSGSKAGHKKALGRGEALEVGRSPLAHFVFEDDSRMSGRHFKVWTDQSACYLEDLQSANGTLVNGQSVKRAVLRDHDEIQAGSTKFVARVEGAAAEVAQVPLKGDDASASESSAYRVETCSNGVFCYSGRSEDPVSIVARFAEVLRPAFVLDVNRLGADIQEGFTPPDNAEPLFDWMPEGVREKVSPLVFPSMEEALPLIGAAWGNDALVGIYVDKDEEPPLEHLHRYSGAFVRPSVLRPQLTQTAAEAAQTFMGDMTAVLVEDEDAQRWLLFSLSDLGPLLQQVGLVQAQQGDVGTPSAD